MNRTAWSVMTTFLLVGSVPLSAAETADLILHRGVIATVDKQFSLAEALAVKGGKLLCVGSEAEALATARPEHQGC